MYVNVLLLLMCSAFVYSEVKIILVGIQKSGTTSYQEWFTAIGLKSAHCGPVAGLIYQAKKENRPLLHHLSNYDAITELNRDTPVKGNFSFSCYYPQITDMERMYLENPGALFILNTRNIQQQVNSMQKSGTGRNILTNCKEYLKDDVTGEPIGLDAWILQHNSRIRSFFRAKPEAKFLEVALETLNSTIFDKYLDSKNIPFPHCNITPHRKR